MADKPINDEHTLLGYLNRLGQDNGADYDDGAEGWFSWEVNEEGVGAVGGCNVAAELTVHWETEGGAPIEEHYFLVRES